MKETEILQELVYFIMSHCGDFPNLSATMIGSLFGATRICAA
jgi:hypothetical protein